MKYSHHEWQILLPLPLKYEIILFITIHLLLIALPLPLSRTMIGWFENAYCGIGFQCHQLFFSRVNIHRQIIKGIDKIRSCCPYMRCMYEL